MCLGKRQWSELVKVLWVCANVRVRQVLSCMELHSRLVVAETRLPVNRIGFVCSLECSFSAGFQRWARVVGRKDMPSSKAPSDFPRKKRRGEARAVYTWSGVHMWAIHEQHVQTLGRNTYEEPVHDRQVWNLKKQDIQCVDF